MGNPSLPILTAYSDDLEGMPPPALRPEDDMQFPLLVRIERHRLMDTVIGYRNRDIAKDFVGSGQNHLQICRRWHQHGPEEAMVLQERQPLQADSRCIFDLGPRNGRAQPA